MHHLTIAIMEVVPSAKVVLPNPLRTYVRALNYERKF
jgi:hypothetical protein